jgi:hypothetical protein
LSLLGKQDGRQLKDLGTLTCTISNKYSSFLWQQGSGNPVFSSSQDTAST